MSYGRCSSRPSRASCGHGIQDRARAGRLTPAAAVCHLAYGQLLSRSQPGRRAADAFPVSFVCSLSSTDFAARRAHGASGANFGVRSVVEVVEPAYAADHLAALSVHDDGLVFHEVSGPAYLGTGAGELVGQGRELVALGQHDAEIGVRKKGSASAEPVGFDQPSRSVTRSGFLSNPRPHPAHRTITLFYMALR
jgi:hypothetical protein